MTDFKHTREALKAYDDEKYMRDARWAAIQNNADVERAQKMDRDAADVVRRAFYEDTKDFNHPDACMRVDIDYLRRIAYKPG